MDAGKVFIIIFLMLTMIAVTTTGVVVCKSIKKYDWVQTKEQNGN